jgi:ATPase involved in DNA repair/ATPase family associated with various cellular activities (AAA)
MDRRNQNVNEESLPNVAPSDTASSSSPADQSEVTSVTSYDLLRERLAAVADRLAGVASGLNDERSSVFAPQPMTLAEQDRVHTEAACLPRDAISVGDLMVLGTNIPNGLQTKRDVFDVFSVYRLVRKTETDWDVIPLPADDQRWFLKSPEFQRDFHEIYRYYADARLVSLGISGDELRMTFGIGTAESDVRTLRWRMPRPGTNDTPTYLDAYGEEDGHAEASFDFSWTTIGREHLVDGRWAHLNVYDSLFIGATKGTLEFRIDDPLVALSEGGRTVGSDKIAESEADIAEHRISAAKVGDLILLRVLPYREEADRYYVYSRLSRRIERIDSIGRGCRMLPEDQGIAFPGGYLLAGGETRVFATDAANSHLIAAHRSPNGEDVLYVYRRPDTGGELLCAYNLVRREMAVPVSAIGYALFPDGTVVCIRDTAEPQRVHTVAIYNSPFCLAEMYTPAVASDSMFGRVGNGELVSGLSEALALAHESGRQGAAGSKTINRSVFEAIIQRATRLLDRHAWMSEGECRGLAGNLIELRKSAGDVLDEMATVTDGQREAALRLSEGEKEVADFLATSELALRDADAFIESLTRAKGTLSKLATLSEVRYIDQDAVAVLSTRVEETYENLGGKAVEFLGQPKAFDGLLGTLAEAGRVGGRATVAAGIDEQIAIIETVGSRTSLLTEVVGALDVADVTKRTAVLGALSGVLAERNSVRAQLDVRRAGLRATENEAAFAATNGVVGQRLQSSLLLATTPNACDSGMAELLADVENAELAYGDVERFAAALDLRRNEISDAFARRRDELVQQRHARIERVVLSAQRTLATLSERASQQADRSLVDTLFATDPLAARVKAAIVELRSLGEEGRSGELEVSLAAARDAARRAVTDRSELFADGMVLLGKHRVGVNNERFDIRLALDPNEPTDSPNRVVARLTGTELTIPLPHNTDSELVRLHPEWIEQSYGSETPTICRALALALAAVDGGLDLAVIGAPGKAVSALRDFAAAHPELGAEPGIHDEDAARFLAALRPVLSGGFGLQMPGRLRGAAAIFRHRLSPESRKEVERKLRTVAALGSTSRRTVAGVVEQWRSELDPLLGAFSVDPDQRSHAMLDIVHLLADPVQLAMSATAARHAHEIRVWATGADIEFDSQNLTEIFQVVVDRLSRGNSEHSAADADLAGEVCALIIAPDTQISSVESVVTVEDLRSSGPGIADGKSVVPIAQRLTEWRSHRRGGVEEFRTFEVARTAVISDLRRALATDQLRPRVITGFVRNRLVDEVLLPLVGDAMAKQLGLNGPAQGLMMLISPPGYGKTTLLEYVADLLGFAMVKVNGPAIGSEVTSLDPATAPDAASAAELIKLNRAFAMGTNTICLIDDIQHLHPELLQRFIPLCDATRRIEGVIDGQARTFDLRGKRFVIAMAGNPYTSVGASFRLPDMLANRADVHNLGDLVATAAMANAFAQSYVENACTSNETLRPLLAGGRQDIETLIGPAQTGTPVETNRLRKAWSSTELGSMVKTIRHLLQVRDVLLKVNAAYIVSAQTTDALRGEPAFLLQGSYRNMARIAQRIVPVMTPAEVQALIVDHYRSEAQTLATNAGWNLAKWRSVVGLTTADDTELDDLRNRWREARAAEDPVGTVVAALKAIEGALRADSATEDR